MATTSMVEHAGPTEWDGQAEIAIGLFIQCYLGTNRPPDDSLIAFDLLEWSDRLITSGQARLVAHEQAAAA